MRLLSVLHQRHSIATFLIFNCLLLFWAQQWASIDEQIISNLTSTKNYNLLDSKLVLWNCAFVPCRGLFLPTLHWSTAHHQFCPLTATNGRTTDQWTHKVAPIGHEGLLSRLPRNKALAVEDWWTRRVKFSVGNSMKLIYTFTVYF